MAAAGLNNGSQDVGDNLIIYTGEKDPWDLSNGAWISVSRCSGRATSGRLIFRRSVTALSFLDSSMAANKGASWWCTIPGDFQGDLTTSSVFPFVLYNQQGQKNGNQNTSWELTDNLLLTRLERTMRRWRARRARLLRARELVSRGVVCGVSVDDEPIHARQ